MTYLSPSLFIPGTSEGEIEHRVRRPANARPVDFTLHFAIFTTFRLKLGTWVALKRKFRAIEVKKLIYWAGNRSRGPEKQTKS
jgi:hypothetical protein